MSGLSGEAIANARIQLRALSIKQPWASAITAGVKLVENRSKPTAYRGLIAIHAAKAVDWDAPSKAWQAAGLEPPGHDRSFECGLAHGAVIGVAEITGCHPVYHICNPTGMPDSLCSPWAVWGQSHWILEGASRLARPVECRGWLGIWVVPPGAAEAVMSQLEAAQ